MLRNLGIRWQILAALALPLLVLVALGGQVTRQAVRDMGQAQQSLELSSTASSVSELVRGLSNERLLTVRALSGSGPARSQLDSVRTANDTRITRIRATMEGSGLPAAYRSVLTSSSAGHAQLPALRAAADSAAVSPEQAADQYSALIAWDVNLPAELAARVPDPAAAATFRRFGALRAAIEALSQEQLTGLLVAASGEATLTQQRQLEASAALQHQLLADAGRAASKEQRGDLSRVLSSPSARTVELSGLRSAFALAGTTFAPAVDAQEWSSVTGSRISALDTLADAVAADGETSGRDQVTNARLRAELTAAGASLLVLMMLLAAMLMARRISQPLGRLTHAATRIRDGLPELVDQLNTGAGRELELPQVPVTGRNEVGRLAAAFTDVNRVAVQVAREQAQLRAAVSDMFVNVARRNQVLLARQVAFIDQLERHEASPEALEDLFRLDHLATRMRRNAESLLVLAGIESGRRLRDPMLLSDVIRTAVSEIEHYERVQLALGTDPCVYPHLALPVAHLLAELLENATNFSDPSSTVVVMAGASPDGIRVTVADEGLGIPAEDLAEINARLDDPPAADALGALRLGFFVVARLAQRLGARVELTSGRAGGTAVLIDLPNALFADESMLGPDGAAGVRLVQRAADPVAPAPQVVPFSELLSARATGELARPGPAYQPEQLPPSAPEPAPRQGWEWVTAADQADTPQDEAVDEAVDGEPQDGAAVDGAAVDGEPQAELVPGPGLTGSSLFSGFRSARTPVETAALPQQREAVAEPRSTVEDHTAEPASDTAGAADDVAPAAEAAGTEPVREQEPVPWLNFAERDILPGKPASLRAVLRLGRRAPAERPEPRAAQVIQRQQHTVAPVDDSPVGDSASGDSPSGDSPSGESRDGSAPPLRRYRDDGSARPTEWSQLTRDAMASGAAAPESVQSVQSVQSAPSAPTGPPDQTDSAATTSGAAGLATSTGGSTDSGLEQRDRSQIASQALTELSRLSSYRPASVQAPDQAGLQRRTPGLVPVVAELSAPAEAAQASGQRTRTAASVRSMLSGFKAGVERGRTSPSAHRPVPRARTGAQELTHEVLESND